VKPLLFSYPDNEALAKSLRDALDAEAVAFALRRFPDGETYLRIDSDVRDRAVALVCTLHQPDARFLPLAFMADTLRDLGAHSIGLVTPYLAYMRQDRRFKPGEALTSSSFARLLSGQFDWLVTVDPHLHRRRSLAEIYTIPAEVVHAAPLLTQWIRGHVTNPIVVGPDAESEQWVRAVAEAVPCPHIVLEKTRHGDRDVVVSAIPNIEGWADGTPVLVDDIISSARTMIETVRQWTRAGLPPPVCMAVHGVFAPQAYEALKEAGAARIVTTNSVPHASNDIDITQVLVEPVRRLLERAKDSRSTRPVSVEK
jgi:ribose-phosphate pyrophosphokinase